MMKTLFTSAAALSMLLTAGTAAAQTEMKTEADAYGGGLVFDVFREGQPFGHHIVRFSQDGGDLIVSSDVELEVSIGPIKAFYYKLQASERWRDGLLVGANAVARKDGEDLQVAAIETDAGLEVDSSAYDGPAPADIIPSSHWNIAEMAQDTILNLEDGALLDVEITPMGTEMVEAGGRMIEAQRYRMVADLTADFWYDAEGRWVKCAFTARGQDIEYVLSDRTPDI